MHSDKSLGSNDMNSIFYQKFWDISSNSVIFSYERWLDSGVVPKTLNETNIVFILKVDKPTSFKDL